MGEHPYLWPALGLRWLALACYLMVTALYTADLVFVRRPPTVPRRVVLALGVLSHLGLLIALGLSLGRLPLGGTFESLGVYAWLIFVAFLLVEGKIREPSVGAFLLPIGTALYVASLLSWRPTALSDSLLRSGWFEVHAVSIFLGYATFSVSFVTGVLYLILAHQLRRKKMGKLFAKLPSLEVLDQVNYRTVAIGFSLLTIGLITGMAWSQSAWGVLWSWEPVQTGALVTWLIFAAYLHARLAAGWQGVRAMSLSIIGFLSSVFTYLAASLLMPGKHGF